ncbi:Fe-Mn family superoxide dismutase [Nonomuraea dietziae]|uniref:Fe-Mn family superoxide dismutase n=1 Tax=Nonomuraea dietziae TaxID=65515 RepID=UPI0033D9F873
MDEHFGAFVAFQKHLTAATSGVRGSGWGVPAYEPPGDRLVVEQVYVHHGNVGMNTTPLPVSDAWEHACAERLWTLVNWDDVANQFADVTSQAG